MTIEEQLIERTQHAIDLVMIDNNKYINRCIRNFAYENGFRVKKGEEGLKEFKKQLDEMGIELEIKLTNLDIEELDLGVVTASQHIRMRFKPKLEG